MQRWLHVVRGRMVLTDSKPPEDVAKNGENGAEWVGQEGQEFLKALAEALWVLGVQCWDKSTEPVANWEESGLWLSSSCSSPSS